MSDVRNYSTLSYLQGLYEAHAPELRFRAENRAEWSEWKDSLRARLRDRLGKWPEKIVDPRPELLESVPEDGFTREKWVIETEPGVSMPLYLLIPADIKPGDRRPAVLALHGHGGGKSDVLGIADSPVDYQTRIRSLDYDYARQFARRGYVVAAPDARCFGERAPVGDGCIWMFTSGLLLGKTLVGMRVWDAMRGIDFLQSRSMVDGDRLACVGLSWGGTHTTYTTALDDRIKVAVISGYFSTYRDIMLDRACCPCQFIPSIMLDADLPDVVGLIAPRPLLIENGKQDPLYTLEVVEEAYRELQRIYEVAGARDHVALDLFEGGHRWSGARAYDWVDRWLK